MFTNPFMHLPSMDTPHKLSWRDYFTGDADTNLTDHIPFLGSSWVGVSGIGQQWKLNGSGYAVPATVGNTCGNVIPTTGTAIHIHAHEMTFDLYTTILFRYSNLSGVNRFGYALSRQVDGVLKLFAITRQNWTQIAGSLPLPSYADLNITISCNQEVITVFVNGDLHLTYRNAQYFTYDYVGIFDRSNSTARIAELDVAY